MQILGDLTFCRGQVLRGSAVVLFLGCRRPGSDAREAQGARESRGNATGHAEGEIVKVVRPRWVPGEKRDLQQVSYFVGVPLNNIFEHLEATIGEATPLYELCASVLQPASE